MGMALPIAHGAGRIAKPILKRPSANQQPTGNEHREPWHLFMRKCHKLYIGGEIRSVMRRFDVGVLYLVGILPLMSLLVCN
jgi:hypothetical protein